MTVAKAVIDVRNFIDDFSRARNGLVRVVHDIQGLILRVLFGHCRQVLRNHAFRRFPVPSPDRAPATARDRPAPSLRAVA